MPYAEVETHECTPAPEPEPEPEPESELEPNSSEHAVHLGMALPAGWETRESRSTGDVYFLNAVTQESTYELPRHAVLPSGWTHSVSTSTGDVFYIDPQGESTYDAPPGAGEPQPEHDEDRATDELSLSGNHLAM